MIGYLGSMTEVLKLDNATMTQKAVYDDDDLGLGEDDVEVVPKVTEPSSYFSSTSSSLHILPDISAEVQESCQHEIKTKQTSVRKCKGHDDYHREVRPMSSLVGRHRFT